MSSYLLTGSSRGIGLGVVAALLAKPASSVALVIATARSPPAGELSQLLETHPQRVKFVQLDAVNAESVERAAIEVDEILGGKGLDVLLNNVGEMPVSKGGIAKMQDLESVFRTNVLSAHIVTAAFMPLLERGQAKTVINISTTLGTFAMSKKYSVFPVPAYKISKAALNMLTVQYAQDFAEKGFVFVALSPGWVQTDLGGSHADLTVKQSAEAILERINQVIEDRTLSGKHLNVKVAGWEERPGALNQYDGTILEW